MKKKNGFRLHSSTLKIGAVAMVFALFITMGAYVRSYDTYYKRLEASANTKVFETIHVKTLDGSTFTAEELKNSELTMFNVWATTCPSCIDEMPDLESLNKEYAGKIQIVGMINDLTDEEGRIRKQEKEESLRIIEKTGVTYPQLIMDKETYTFVDSNIIGTPTSFFVDSQGHIVDSVTGARRKKEWKETFDAVLQKAKEGENNEQ